VNEAELSFVLLIEHVLGLAIHPAGEHVLHRALLRTLWAQATSLV
jgi:hypothetical protein